MSRVKWIIGGGLLAALYVVTRPPRWDDILAPIHQWATDEAAFWQWMSAPVADLRLERDWEGASKALGR